MRIVSLLPSATEIVFELGLGDELVGVTFECDHPPDARSKRIVSTSSLSEGMTPGEIDAAVKQRLAAGEDLYHLDRNAFADLDPTLVLTQDLCAVCAIDVSHVDDALAYLGCRAEVVTLDPKNLTDVIDTICTVAQATGTSAGADRVVAALRQRLDTVASLLADAPRPNTLVLEWTDPAYTAGHWVPDLVESAGGQPLLATPGGNSIGVEWSVVTGCDAEVVVVAPCGFGLDSAAELGRELLERGVLPDSADVWAIDADAYMVRPGPRLVSGVEILASILHPDRFGPPDPDAARRLR